ncbi:MAG: serine/threonine-protein kinase [Anaerolineae bacterium]|nr:serine/threonine protein kinase [Candidatus Roseilinea sp.]MDW8451599.1 serine/threonine-protein kinase [Anaerolineae bacterium]
MRSFGPYTNLVEIGRGGMAAVYRATAPDGRLVALKLLPPHLAADATMRARFEQESNLGLNHPNIVRVNRSGVVDGTPYIEMEYVSGESLDRLVMRNGPLSPEMTARILLDAGRALDYAHARGVIHRDVKPSNVIIQTNGSALLADFGVAKAMGITAYTATMARVGSVFFMSPEQAAGAFEITPASDIYSLGATAYYALTGRAPFEAGSDVAIARQHIEQPPRHVSDLRPTVPRAVGDVVMWALQKLPSQRPVSAGAFARSFAAALSVPSSTPPQPRPQPQPQPAPRQPPPAPIKPATVDEALEQRGRTPAWLLAGFAGTVALAGLAIFAVILFALPADQPAPRPTPTRALPQATARPALFVFTVQPTATPASVLAPATATPRPVVPVLPVLVATATPQIVFATPTPTRFVPPTRAPIIPLTPITSNATPPPPAPTPPPPTLLPPPPATDTPLPSPLPTPEIIVVTTAP